jgi:hypothetical protein
MFSFPALMASIKASSSIRSPPSTEVSRMASTPMRRSSRRAPRASEFDMVTISSPSSLKVFSMRSICPRAVWTFFFSSSQRLRRCSRTSVFFLATARRLSPSGMASRASW